MFGIVYTAVCGHKTKSLICHSNANILTAAQGNSIIAEVGIVRDQQSIPNNFLTTSDGAYGHFMPVSWYLWLAPPNIYICPVHIAFYV